MRQATLLDCLLASEIRFVLIGGMAAVAHGSGRMTRDWTLRPPRHRRLLRLPEAHSGP